MGRADVLFILFEVFWKQSVLENPKCLSNSHTDLTAMNASIVVKKMYSLL